MKCIYDEVYFITGGVVSGFGITAASLKYNKED